MKLAATRYNAQGELLAPSKMELNVTVTLGGTPTTEAGFYHAFSFSGRNRDEAYKKLGRFFTEMQSVAGYMTLSSKETDVWIGTSNSYVIDLVYVVEAPRFSRF